MCSFVYAVFLLSKALECVHFNTSLTSLHVLPNSLAMLDDKRGGMHALQVVELGIGQRHLFTNSKTQAPANQYRH